uniref:Aminopeptidase NAALADL1 n=1 Tax=Chelonoidis abingdonii TaxID=106734 RepID=A0A8C0J9Y8_CHEAB
MSWLKILGAVIVGALLLTVGILLGHFAIPKGGNGRGAPSWVQTVGRDLNESLLQSFMDQVDSGKIRENLKALASQPHMATTKGDEELVKLLLSRWQDPQIGLDSASEDVYGVFLSFPDPQRPNSVAVGVCGSQIFSTRRSEKNVTADQAHADVVQPYAAYAPPGNPRGRLVYANQGKRSDYLELVNMGINLNGTVAITRYGGAGRANKAVNGAEFGVAGVVVYTDPADINDGRAFEEETYPNSWYLPPSGVERGSYSVYFGDLLTPYYPAKGNIGGAPIPTPSKEVWGGAETLTTPYISGSMSSSNLSGPVAPASWQGSLGCSYHVGPGFRTGGLFPNTSDVQVNVHNQRVIKNSSNVMGFIRGSEEPDRYVLYGNHRDSWVHGAIDPSSGTAVMLEITRVLGKMLKEGMRVWGVHRGATIPSEFYSKLRERSVAYINVDISVFANATLRAQGTPPAQSVIFAAAKQVPGSSMSVYDNWRNHFSRISPSYGVIPNLGSLGAGSDYASFIHYLGITSMDIAYTYDRNKTSARIYPAYHTAFDTFDYADRFIDPGFTSHQAVARTVGNVLLRLADSLILPLNVSDYGEKLDELYSAATQGDFLANLNANNLSLGPLKAAIGQFKSVAADFNQRIMKLKEEESPSPLQIRMVNDQIMLLERAFLNPQAFPNQYYYSHVIWASKSSDQATFPGLADAYTSALETGDWDQVRKHLTIVVQAVESAASTLEAMA